MEFEVKDKTDNYLRLQKDDIGVELIGMNIRYSQKKIIEF